LRALTWLVHLRNATARPASVEATGLPSGKELFLALLRAEVM
jgi:hypothetical protein